MSGLQLAELFRCGVHYTGSHPGIPQLGCRCMHGLRAAVSLRCCDAFTLTAKVRKFCTVECARRARARGICCNYWTAQDSCVGAWIGRLRAGEYRGPPVCCCRECGKGPSARDLLLRQGAQSGESFWIPSGELVFDVTGAFDSTGSSLGTSVAPMLLATQRSTYA